MDRILRFQNIVFLLCCLLLCQVPVALSEEVSPKDEPSAAESSDALSQNLQDLMSRLSAVEASDTLAPKDKLLVIDLYQRAIDNLRVVEDNRNKASQYIDQMNSAPARLMDLQQDLDNVREAPPLPDSLSAAVLEQELLQEQSELLRLRNAQAELSSKALTEPQNATSLLEEALQAQAAALAHANQPLTAETLEVTNAREVFQRSEVSAANSRVDMLRQRTLSRDSRLQVLDRERQLLDRQIKAATAIVTQLENKLNQVRQTDAEARAQQAQQREAQVDSAGEEIKAIAAGNAELAADLSLVARRTDTLLKHVETLRQERARVDRYYSSMTQQLAIAGADRLAALSVDLLAQRQQFAQNLPPAIDTRALDKELTTAHMQQLKLEDRQLAVDDADEAGADALQQELLAESQQLIQDAVSAYRRYTAVLMEVLSENKGLQTQVNEYRNLLDSRLFWIPSLAPLQVNFLSALQAELRALVNVQRWQHMLSPRHTSAPSWIAGMVLVLLAAGIVLWQANLKAYLEHWGNYVGKVNRDRFTHTLLSLLVSVALVLPVPAVLLAFVIWLPPGALAQGLAHTAVMWFGLGLLFQLARRGGLADVHFKWDATLLQKIRKHCVWFALVLTIPLLLTPVASAIGGAYQVINRLLFAAVAVLVLLGVHTLLKPGFALLSTKTDRTLATIPRQRRILISSFYVLFMLLPLVMWGLSWSGYHFTAEAIQSRLFLTLGLLTLVLIAYSLAVRAVAVLERRLKLERLLVQRAAERELQASKQAAEEAAEAVPDVIDVPEVDMVQVSQQSRAFVSWVAALIGFWFCWAVWDNLLPALNVFDSVQLWHIASEDPNIPTRAVTVFDLLVALVILILTYLGVRNLPGVLEISVLRVMKLEPGANYAITTVVKYVIVLIGTVAALNLIGVQWSKLQWLVAAIGVGLGFGLQEILANFVSGLLILFERPIRVGDTITVGGQTGTVSKIRIRATTLTDGDRKEQIIPNKVFITSQLTNWTLSDPMIRCVIKVGVAYGSDVLLVHKLLTGILATNPRVVREPAPAVFFTGFGASSLDFELRAFVPTLGDQMPLMHELHLAINKTFTEQGIEMPFPQHDVWIREAPGAAHHEGRTAPREANRENGEEQQ